MFEGTVLHFRNNSSESFEQLRNRVATKGGVTQAGLDTMNNFESHYDAVFDASLNRAKEMLADSKKPKKD